jgi:hypothetical protein
MIQVLNIKISLPIKENVEERFWPNTKVFKALLRYEVHRTNQNRHPCL